MDVADVPEPHGVLGYLGHPMALGLSLVPYTVLQRRGWLRRMSGRGVSVSA